MRSWSIGCEQYAGVTAERFVPRLERESAIRHARKRVVDLRLEPRDARLQS